MGEYWGPRGQRAVASQIGVLAPRMADVALGLQVINGQAWTGAPSCALGDYTQIDVSRLRVAFYTDDGTFSVSPAVARAVHLAAQTLRDAGARVAAWSPPGAPASLNLFYGILGADKVEVMRQRFGPGKRTPQISQLMALASVPLGVIKLMRPLLRLSGQPSLANALESFGSNTIGHYWQLVEAQIDYQKQFADALDNAPGGPFDVILCPPCALPAYTHGASRDLLTAGAYATLYNLLGYPAGVVPVTKVLENEQGERTPLRDIVQKMALQVEQGSAGLPVGVQVVARPWREDVALAAMAAIEQEARQHADFSPPPVG
jgi:fatty acid amide hydrolase